MKVKILRCVDKKYSEIVGQVFEVIDQSERQYIIDLYGEKLFISKSNAEVVEEIEKSCDNCRLSVINRKNKIRCDDVVGKCRRYDKWQPIKSDGVETKKEVEIQKSCKNCNQGHKYKTYRIDGCPIICSMAFSGWRPIKSDRQEKYDELWEQVKLNKQATGATEAAKHYQIGNQQPIEVMQSTMTPEQFIGFLLGNIIKYSQRINHKDKMREDAGKCAQYSEWLCMALDGQIIVPGGK